MDKTEQKIVQYLSEAHATEKALVTVLQSQIAMTPGGSYRDGLESHLRETRGHAIRVQRRLDELGQGSSLIQAGVGLVQSVIGQALALGKTPLDLVRGTGGEEKLLKNAKDACATEALEIATYTAIARLASAVGDKATQALADSIRADPLVIQGDRDPVRVAGDHRQIIGVVRAVAVPQRELQARCAGHGCRRSAAPRCAARHQDCRSAASLHAAQR